MAKPRPASAKKASDPMTFMNLTAGKWVSQAIAVAVLATVLVSTLSPAVRQAQAQAQESQHVSNAPQPGLCRR